MVEKPPFTVEAPGYAKVEGETIPRRHPQAKDGLLQRPEPGINTTFDIIKKSAEKYANEPAVGSRKLIRTHNETKKIPKVVDGEITQVDKQWTYFELSGYEYQTYAEYETMCLELGAGLRKLGLDPGDKIHLFATTSAHWLGIAHAACTQSIPVVTAYDTLGPKGVEHSLVQTGAKAIYTDPHLLKTITDPLNTATSVEYIIYNDTTLQPIPKKEIEQWKESHSKYKVISLTQLRQLGADNPRSPTPPNPQDLFCIMYTSGSMGPPKGVPVSHAQFISAIAGLYSVVKDCVSKKEYVLAYLPLAHIFEFVVENLVLFIGATLGYGSPKTLADSSMKNCAGDMREFKPTIMVGVPQIWETVRKGIVGKVEKSSSLIQTLFWGAFKAKSFLVAHGLPFQTAFDSSIFGQVRTMTGGRLRFIVNGASGISSGTQHFMSMVVAPMISGYGLTETCGNGALGCPLQYTNQAIGPMPGSIEIKLVSAPELNYSTDSNPPQGEIWVRGGPTVIEYWKNPEETSKAITKDGWFRTGDIGEFDANGHIKVIDRLKNLVKLQGGEYIALERLESIYRGSSFVHNMMIYGSGEHPRPIAIISANEKPLVELAEKLGVEETHMHSNKKVESAVLKDLQQVGKASGLSPLEIIAGVVIVDEEWTPASGLVTATQKVNRRALKEKYMKDIEKCYKAS